MTTVFSVLDNSANTYNAVTSLSSTVANNGSCYVVELLGDCYSIDLRIDLNTALIFLFILHFYDQSWPLLCRE